MAANWSNELGHTQWNNFCQSLKKNGDIKRVIIFYLKDKKTHSKSTLCWFPQSRNSIYQLKDAQNNIVLWLHTPAGITFKHSVNCFHWISQYTRAGHEKPECGDI